MDPLEGDVVMEERAEPEPVKKAVAPQPNQSSSHKKKKGSKKPVVIHPGSDESITFADRLGSHPVVNTAIKLEYSVEDYRPWSPDKPPSSLSGRNLNELFVGPPRDVDFLPPSWAPAPPLANDPEAWRIAQQLLVVFVPISAIPSTPKFQVSDHAGAVGMAFYFFNKALATSKIGTHRNDGSLHRFLNNHGQSIPKIEVFAEVVVKESDGLLKQFMAAHYSQYSVVETNAKGEKIHTFSKEGVEKATADVRFREKILTRKNIAGVRFILVANDPVFDAGRAFQKREFRNQVLTGEFSPKEVVEREDAFSEERKKRSIEREKAWKAKKKANKDGDNEEEDAEAANHTHEDADYPHEQPIASADPREDERKAKLAKLLKEMEEARVRGEDEEAGNILKLIEKEHAAAQRGPSRQDMIAHNIKRAKELYLVVEQGTFDRKHPSMLLKIKDQQDKFSTSSAMGSASSKRTNFKELRDLSDEQKKEYAGLARGADAAVVSVKRMRDILHVMGALLNVPTEKAGSTDSAKVRELRQRLYARSNEMMNENIDLGSRDCYYHPTKWLTFQNIVDGWGLDGIACKEQVNHSNYKSDAGELQFPIPSLVWRLAPEKGFKAKALGSQPPIWEFDPLFEKLEEIERKYEQEQRQRHAEAQQAKAEDYILKTHKLIDNIPEGMVPAERKKRLKEAEDRNATKFRQSSYYKDQETFDKKYPSSVIGTPQDSYFSNNASSSADQRDKELHNCHVRDIIADEVERAEQLETRVLEACKKAPEEEASLIRSFRKHQFKVYASLMRPDAHKQYPNNPYGMNTVHKKHVEYLSEGSPSNPTIYFGYTGYENLTFNASLIAEWIQRMKNIVNVTNSIHVLWTMFAQMNVNAYYNQRKHGIHVIKVGAPGCGKSHMDDVMKLLKIPGTVEEAIHSSDMSKLVEVPQDDRFIIEDEANQNLVGDASKSTNSQDYKAKMLNKAYLGNKGTMGFTVFAHNAEGVRVAVHKIVYVRSVQSSNSNIFNPAKDGSIYDRLLRYILVPTSAPTQAGVEILNNALAPCLSQEARRYIESNRPLDALQFRVCKMIATRACAEPNINDTILHLMKGIATLAKYSISMDSSQRKIIVGMELAKALTVTMAIFRTFFMDGPTVRKILGSPAEARPWSEAMMKEVQYALYADQTITCLTLCQVYRQIIGDYAGWHSIYYIGKALLGHMDVIFDDLFEREAYEYEDRVMPDGSKRRVRTNKKLFPFIDLKTLSKNRTEEQIDQFVKDEDKMFKQWEVLGFRRRKMETHSENDDLKSLRWFPSFVCYRKDAVSLSADEKQKQSDSFRTPAPAAPKAPPPKHARANIINGVPPSFNPVDDAPAANAGFTATRPTAQKTSESYQIDPNWLIFRGFGLKEAVQTECRDRSSSAFTNEAISEYAIRHMCEGRTITVPLLNLINDADEDFSFVTHEGEDGKRVPVQRAQKICEVKGFSDELVDCYTGRTIPPGNHLVINTMALRCFRPLAVLFKFLCALEYRHTPVETMLTDLAIPGHEGVHYTHTSYPRQRGLSYASSTTVNSAFIRTYMMEHTRTQFELFVDGDLPSAEGISKAVDIIDEAMIKKSKEQAQVMESDEVQNALKAVMEKDEEEKVEESAVTVQYADTTTVSNEKAFARNHMPAGCDQDQSSRHMASLIKTKGKFYEEYHVYVEYKQWLVSQYGKEIKNGKRDISTKKYYPGNADRRVTEAIKYGDSGIMGRILWGGKRVVYPQEVIESVEKEAKAAAESKKRPLAAKATCYTSISVETCIRVNKMFTEQLKIQRERARERIEHKNKVKHTSASDALKEALAVQKLRHEQKMKEALAASSNGPVLGSEDSHDAAVQSVQRTSMNTDGTTKAPIIGAGLSATTAEEIDPYDDVDFEQMEREAEEKSKKKQRKEEKKEKKRRRKERKEKHHKTPEEGDVPMEDSNSSSVVEEVPSNDTDMTDLDHHRSIGHISMDPETAFVVPHQGASLGRPRK
jgi:hypothetical protein